jgi:Ca-activated chloride channel family protein
MSDDGPRQTLPAKSAGLIGEINIMRNLAPVLVAAMLGLMPSALAQSNDGDPLETLSGHYMKGYETRDPSQLLDQVLATLEPASSQSSVFLPSARIRPLTMAVLALEAAEGPRDRVRYRISYGIELLPDLASDVPYPVSFIQIDRFSLGSAIRQDALASYGADNVAPPEAFDVGPHVSWRLITRPVQGAASDIVAAGRTELSQAQAQEMTCLSNPCLSPVMEVENSAAWDTMEQMSLNHDPVSFQVERSGLLSPAAAIDQLTRESGFNETGRFRETPQLPDPFLEAVLEINLAQGSILQAGMRRGDVKDDAIAAIWRRLVILPMGENAQSPTAYSAKAYECRRGPQFPPNGLCP